MMEGLHNPLAVVNAVNILHEQLHDMGIALTYTSNFELFATLRDEVRSEKVSPMFDPEVNTFTEKNAFCMIARNSQGNIAALQACRLDTVDGNLADWAMKWMAGHYLMRSELVTPSNDPVPASSVTQSITGNIVYHGEVWLDHDFREKICSPIFPRLALLMSLLKWQPNAIWGLIGGPIATRGLSIRIGYPHMENNFFRWEIAPVGAENSEYITLATKSDLEFLALDTIAKPL